jgi:MFS family permease
LETTCHIDFDQAKIILIVAIVLATPFFLLFGGWSDRIGRKWIMITGMALAVLSYQSLFRQLLNISDPAGRTEITAEKEIRTSSAFIGKTRNLLRSSSTIRHYEDGMIVTETKKDTLYEAGNTSIRPVTEVSKKLGTADYWKMIGIIFLMIIYVTMVYGPIAAFLVELFPTRIRYTSMSLPYHIGNGVFGGLTPFIAVLLTTISGNKLSGLWYPVIVIAVCLIIGAVYIPAKARPVNE